MAMEQNNGNNEFSGDNPFIVPPAGMFEPLSGDQFEITAPGNMPEAPHIPFGRQFETGEPGVVTRAHIEATSALNALRQWRWKADDSDLFENRTAAVLTNGGEPYFTEKRSITLESATADGAAFINDSAFYIDARYTDALTDAVTRRRYYVDHIAAAENQGGMPFFRAADFSPDIGDTSYTRPKDIADMQAAKVQAWQQHLQRQRTLDVADQDPVVGVDELHFLHELLSSAQWATHSYDEVLESFSHTAAFGRLETTAIERQVTAIDNISAAQLYGKIMDAYRLQQMTPAHMTKHRMSTRETRHDAAGRTETVIDTAPFADVKDMPSMPDYPVQNLRMTIEHRQQAGRGTLAYLLQQRHFSTRGVPVDGGVVVDSIDLTASDRQVHGTISIAIIGEDGDVKFWRERIFTPSRADMELLRDYLLARPEADHNTNNNRG